MKHAVVRLFFIFLLLPCATARAAELTFELGGARGVTFVGALERWDRDGNLRKPPDPKATIDAPAVDAAAVDAGDGRWVFKNLPPGTYDLVILADGHRRFEGFQFAPVREFDPMMTPEMKVDDATRAAILEQIKNAPHYENLVEPLHLAGDRQSVRVLICLVRDRPTTYHEVADAATIRHEIWQYTWQYGGWRKEKRTRVLDRVLLDRDELRRWTWTWDPKLGGVTVADRPAVVEYRLPAEK